MNSRFDRRAFVMRSQRVFFLPILWGMEFAKNTRRHGSCLRGRAMPGCAVCRHCPGAAGAAVRIHSQSGCRRDVSFVVVVPGSGDAGRCCFGKTDPGSPGPPCSSARLAETVASRLLPRGLQNLACCLCVVCRQYAGLHVRQPRLPKGPQGFACCLSVVWLCMLS